MRLSRNLLVIGALFVTAISVFAAAMSGVQRNGAGGQSTGLSPAPGSGSGPVGTGPNPSPAPRPGTTAPPVNHVVVIVLENEEQSAVDSSSAPYQSYLATTYAQATNFYGACHYSYPDYTAMTSGRYFACGTASIPVEGVTNLADLLEDANLSWMAYFESMSNPCQLSSEGSYLAYHNPFIAYQDIRSNTTRCDEHVVNSAAFNESVANGTLPAFSYYIPNAWDDCYRSNLSFCDKWLDNFLSPILNSTNPVVRLLVASTVFFITYDEGEESGSAFYAGYSTSSSQVNSWCENETQEPLSVCGGLVYAVAVSPWSINLQYTANASDYSLQSTVEWLLRLGSDGGWDGTAGFPPMTGLFH